jgi:hypothetical protein
MKLFKVRSGDAARSLFISTAESFVGMTVPNLNAVPFTQAIGRQGTTWNGVFIDYCATKAGLGREIPSHISTASALGTFVKSLQLHARPRPGDIAFFELSTDVGPRVGIVTDITMWDTYGMFKCVEAQTDSGLPRGDKIENGVFKRNRYKYEVIGFARPNFARAINELTDAAEADPDAAEKDIMKPLVKSFTWRPGIKHPDVALVQLALSTINELQGARRGEWDQVSQAAFANFQRRIGYTQGEANGIPDGKTLNELAMRTGLFRI